MSDSDHEFVWKIFKEPKKFSWKHLWWINSWVVVKYARYNNDMNLPCYPPYNFNTEKEAQEFLVLKTFEQ